MAARVIPYEDNVAAQNINITSTGALPEGCFLQAGQAITFTNNSGASVDITFEPNPPGPPPGPTVFTNISGLAPNNTSAPQPPSGAGSVNYNVTVGGNQYGPYSIQVGLTSAMYVQVSGNNTTGITCNPAVVAIPYNATLGGGKVVMVRFRSTDNYDVAWVTTDPFNPPPLSSVDSTPHTDKAPAGEYDYTVTTKSIAAGGGGGGKIKVQST